MAEPRAAAPVVEVVGLTKRFGAVTAVEGLGFTVQRGTTCALLGGNGAGKTTTLSMLLGLLLPTSGRIRILGRDMLHNRYAVLARMNFSSPYVDLPQRLTVYQNLNVYAHRYGTLSAGQRTRVGLAKSLLNRPEVLLLDEPTASLDPDTADRVRGYLEQYRADTGATLLLASHNMAEVERMCDAVIILRAGRIVDRGRPSALIQRYGRHTLEEVFLDIARSDGSGAGSAGS